MVAQSSDEESDSCEDLDENPTTCAEAVRTRIPPRRTQKRSMVEELKQAEAERVACMNKARAQAHARMLHAFTSN